MVKELFRRGLGYALQWYDHLQDQLLQSIDDVLEVCDYQARNVVSAGNSQARNEAEVPIHRAACGRDS
jgi:hypothetical protein